MSRFESTDPCTGAVLWQGAAGDVAAAVAAARQALPGWATSRLADRVAVARAFQAIVTARADAFARLIASETGKPLWETRTEVASVAAKVDISITAQAERAGMRSGEVGGVRQVLRHKPHGVLAVLGPYNFPAHLPNGHIVPALLAGNTVVFKPSELTPAVADFMADCWAAAGLPAGVLNIVQGGGDTGRDLAAADIDGLLFTGSAHVGAALARQFADTPGRILALEMGGNNPLIIWDLADAALDAAAALIVQSAYLSAGQRCTCARRLIVRDGAHAPLLDRVTALLDRIIVGAPFDDPQPFMGPVIANRAADGLVAGADTLVARGARTLRPLTRRDPGLPFLLPALYDVTGVSGLPDAELFGPVLQLTRVADWDAAIAAANATRFGLSAGLIGGDAALYDRLWTASRAGVVNWNRPTNGAASNAPFGGIGLSGNHRPSAYYAADYAAWPVASLEADSPDATITTGLGA
ncbi:succinylglutamate-semialdehyde dehydrogenase [Polymorphobacter fuscus]|uniref:Succinylglutamate-semialdehyde dehydrogenase n=1 Tax=Sandarakinorhabdus fusca TaxID=1439888 RepID=A0A7C9GU89_9SPHN|nr:succinylglutamate-semialdehyde dehydrogenase [Polymorphobacter fuscus]KAB7647388.1 succinylglutamate-semialdehyde dehydrogenase [Polymorphobacter fuscus]MQT16629.1 succinylglutamate-semialdehyde dehydrogenase [Polymorphobacter fuscus]NJC09388.1 succinylglutamic semialdehyde dehydrogenase [Polymorphobacter fuscus]